MRNIEARLRIELPQTERETKVLSETVFIGSTLTVYRAGQPEIKITLERIELS
jgi:hypothetical protein